MKRPSEDLSPHFQEMAERFRRAEARSHELAEEAEAAARQIRDMLEGAKPDEGGPPRRAQE